MPTTDRLFWTIKIIIQEDGNIKNVEYCSTRSCIIGNKITSALDPIINKNDLDDNIGVPFEYRTYLLFLNVYFLLIVIILWNQ